MKKYILFFISAFLFTSCKDRNQSLSNEKPVTLEITDKDFSNVFATIKGVQLDDSKVVRYNEITGKDEASLIPQLVTEPLGCTALPTAITQLNSGSGYEYYKFTQEGSAEASFMGFGGSIGKKEMLLIQDYVRYQEVTCNGVKKRVGIGLRCYIHVKGIKASFKGSYADIAANAQLSNMSANFSLKSLGFAIQGDLIADGLAGENDYNVDNFGKIAITFTNVLKTLNNNNTGLVVSPVELPFK
ncbi:hypothetical protein [Flavobacterium sp. XS2P39]|uniref:hypothetical protein n=1 Tax=Flavobacterium sp. XS2P39 TaxID=3401725 RepID=UPI003AB0B2FA